MYLHSMRNVFLESETKATKITSSSESLGFFAYFLGNLNLFLITQRIKTSIL